MERRGPKLGDAKSLWNFTSSPGWAKEECHILKLCLMKFSVGQWAKIQKSGLLPGKTIQQLNGQTQRLLGQQSLAGCTGLHVDIDRIREHNETRMNVTRKCGLIIYSGAPPTKKMKQQWRTDTQAKYGLKKEEIERACELLEEILKEKKLALPAAQPDAPDSSLMELDASSLDREGRLGLLIHLRSHLVKLVDLYGKQKQKQGENPPQETPVKQGMNAGKERKTEEESKLVATEISEVFKKPQPKQAAGKQAPAKKATAPPRDARVLGDTQLQHQEGNGLAPTVASPIPSRKRSIAEVLGKKPRDKAFDQELGSLSPSEKASKPTPAKKRSNRPNKKRMAVAACGAPAAKKRGIRSVDADLMEEDSRSAAEVAFETDIQSIVSMGFSVRLAKEALQESNLNVDRAVEYLLQNCT
ncbi:hypothetical protein BSKO_13238 [Bryopsis sp. KO-2023]|nr:hypothetical protein BSKO_13238 [Bryopsis sp. KO-2023]